MGSFKEKGKQNQGRLGFEVSTRDEAVPPLERDSLECVEC